MSGTDSDGQPEVPQMVEIGGGWSMGGAPARDILSRLSDDERLGAVVGHYRGGNFIVHLNLYERGHSLKKRALPKWQWVRRLIANDAWPFFGATWSYQANFYGAGEASSESTKVAAIARAKSAIVEMIATRERRGHQ